MWLRVLGSAAGGGFPQWNCGCEGCRTVRDGSRPCQPRTQSSVAVSVDYRRWILLNASPDVRTQIESFPALRPDGARATPLRAVLLTDGELDHSLGLLLLREGGRIEVHATSGVRSVLCDGTAVLRTLARYAEVDWRPVTPGTTVSLGAGLSYRAFEVPTTKRSRFGARNEAGRVVGYRMIDEHTGRSFAYLPCVQDIATVREELLDCACLLVDGTCWQDDELVRLGLGNRSAREMGHVPISGPHGSLEKLAALPAERKIYVHMNNTNPVLLEDGPERRAVEERGMEVATDGLEVRV